MKAGLKMNHSAVDEVAVVHTGNFDDRVVFLVRNNLVPEPYANRLTIEIGDLMELDNVIHILSEFRKKFARGYEAERIE